MISQRNPSHEIPDTMTSASPVHLPATSHRPTASRPASRRTVSPDGSAHGSTPSCPLLARSSCLLTHLVPSHRSISSAHPFRPLLASLRPMRLIHLIHLIHLIRFAPSHWLIALPHRMRRATSRRNGARDGQSTTVKRNATTSDTSPIPQTPIPASRIASTSRITHGHSHEHAHDKTPPPRPSQRL